MANDNKPDIDLSVGLDPTKAIKAAARFQKEMSNRLKLIEKSEDGISNSITRYLKKVGSAKRVFGPVLQKQIKLQGELTKSIETSSKEVKQHTAELQRQESVLKAIQASNKKGPEKNQEIKEAKEKIALQKQLLKESSGSLKSAKSGLKNVDVIAREARQQIEIEPELPYEAAREFGEEMVKPFQSYMKKDFGGAFEGAMGAIKGGAKGFRAMGKMDTGSMGAGPLKALAGLSKTLAKPMAMLAKMAPLFGLMASSIMGLVKLFLDAESAAKDYQKQVLQTASTSQYLVNNMGDVGAASNALEKDLKDLRGGAMDWSNVQWGISKETASAFQSALFAEGVAMNELGEETKKATGYATSHARVIQMSVGYSRSFGVSLNEITQLQGEMMTEMGMGLAGVNAGFQSIVEGAKDAGITSNKFFGMVRSFSSDLTLFTLRIQELTKVMGALGQAMSPREAQKFMQDLAGKFQGDLQGNLRATVIGGGGATRGIAKRDVEGKMTGMLEDIRSSVGAGAAGELEKLMRDPKRDPRAIAQWQAKHNEDVNGDLMSSVHDAVFVLDKIASGNEVNTASILGMLSPLAKRDVVQQQSMKLIGKRIEDASGTELLALINSGIVDNVEQIRAFTKMNEGLLTRQEDTLSRIAEGNATPEELKRLSTAFEEQITNGADSAKNLRKLMDAQGGEQKFWDSLDQSQKELLEKGTAEIDYQKETARFQTSSMDQMSIIADILMNYVYDILTDIWGTITKVASHLWGSDVDQKDVFATQASKLRDPNMMKAVKSADNVWDARNAVAAGAGRQVLADIQAGVKEHAKLSRDLKGATGDEKEAIEAKLKQLEPLLKFKDVKEKDFYEKINPGGSGLLGGADQGIGTVDVSPEEMLNKILTMKNAVAGSGIQGGTGSSEKQRPPSEGNQKETTDSIKKVNRTLEKGVALSKPSAGYTRATEESTLSAIRTALFEYYMYSNMDPSQMISLMREGKDPMSAIASLPGAAAETGSVQGGFGKLLTQANATGGVVAGLAGNMARVNSFPPAPPGEGWASVGPGETILPKGRGGKGGGTVVELRLKGDLGKFIDAKVVDGVSEFTRNRRLR